LLLITPYSIQATLRIDHTSVLLKMSLPSECDVLVVGSGNAGFSAAVSAVQSGAKSVVLIDKCPEEWAGGNTYFTAGAYRTVHGGLLDLLPVVNNVDTDLASQIDLGPYSEDDFANDMYRICMGRSDPQLAHTLISESNSTIKWLAKNGIRFQLSFNRQAYKLNDRYQFWGGLALKTQDGGKGLVEDHIAAAHRHGVTLSWSTALTGVDHQKSPIHASVSTKTRQVKASVLHEGMEKTIYTHALVFAAGGFEANPRMRCQFLGPGWDMAMVRGTPYNTGDCLELAIRELDAKPAGNWSGCHSVAWDANANANVGSREASNEYTKSGYPLGLMLNTHGKRFVDEGVDLRNYTYARFGKAILAQPDHIVFQVWDAQTSPWLREEEYRDERVERITANTLEELADKCAQRGLQDRDQFVATFKEYNEAVYAHRRENLATEWNPAIRDGVSTQSKSKQLEVPKSNWALAIDKAPFLAVKVSCGITFTFGGLTVDPKNARLIQSTTGEPLPNVFCVGEMIGGLFYNNYAGGSGLTSGAVFGRRAGDAAAKVALAASKSEGKSDRAGETAKL
jgi:precorrin 3B synthase CobZ